MAGRIPRQFIDDLLARTDIVGLIDQRVRLKKTGKNYSACCPFHNEKSPSFSVSPDKQFYHCFGCGEHGNALSFLMEYDQLEFVEAVEELASSHNLQVPREEGNSPVSSKPAYPQAQNLYELCQQAAVYFQKQLRNNPNKASVIDYLKGRGLSGEIVKQYAIGFAPEQWDALCSQFGKTSEQRKLLLDAGLLIRNDSGREYDRFRNRIMFPIRDRRGRCIGFGGRVMGDDTPKYLNSPETPIFHKGRELYGFYEVRQAYKTIPQILVVEGYMDVVSLAQFGLNYAVASLGTATTTEHLQLLFRATGKVVCCFDGDRAGREAAWRALENALPLLRDNVELSFMFLPDGEDPDTLVREEGLEQFEVRISNAESLTQFMFRRLTQDLEINSDTGKSQLAAQAKALIEQVPAQFYREALLDQLALHTRWTREQLERNISAPKAKHQLQGRSKEFKLTPIRRAIAMCLQAPQVCVELELSDFDQLSQLNLKGMSLLVELLQRIQQYPQVNTGQLLEHWRERSEYNALSRLAMHNLQIDETQFSEEFQDIIAGFIDQLLQQRYDALNLKSLQGSLSREEKLEMNQLLLILKT
ncbi:DNA primase [Alginatibacterium sediminis]|uniref:DNA primase n=1 Tax=Alginatibacterium sediminis TaxID=2164068 RepID=A0A420ECP6_9ALTE|nr:DNA primase [Alginatibacterium sediminis]RKF18431.1 DNA primase [Alginatibacterium sediminis]